MTPAHRSVHVAPLVVSALVLGATFASGVLAASEAVRLRGHYCEQEPCPDDKYFGDIERTSVSTGYKVATGVAIAGGLTTILINASLPHTRIAHEVSGVLGIMAGVMGLGFGLPMMTWGTHNFRPIAAVSAGVGALSVLLGVYALATPAPKSPGPPEKLESATLRAAPWVGPGGAGIMVGLRF